MKTYCLVRWHLPERGFRPSISTFGKGIITSCWRHSCHTKKEKKMFSKGAQCQIFIFKKRIMEKKSKQLNLNQAQMLLSFARVLDYWTLNSFSSATYVYQRILPSKIIFFFSIDCLSIHGYIAIIEILQV